MTVSPLAPAAFPAMPDIKGVTLSTAASGMKYTGRDDMLLMRLDGSGSIAAVFTKSDTAAAPVQWCRQQLGTGGGARAILCLLYTSPSPRDLRLSRMPSSA